MDELPNFNLSFQKKRIQPKGIISLEFPEFLIIIFSNMLKLFD